MAIARPSIMAHRPRVIVTHRESMNLLGLMTSSLLDRKLSDEKTLAHALALEGDVSVEASGMQITLRFSPDQIEVTREHSPRPRASVTATLPALLDAALGRKRLRNVAAGKLRVMGSPKTLWHLLGLLRV